MVLPQGGRVGSCLSLKPSPVVQTAGLFLLLFLTLISYISFDCGKGLMAKDKYVYLKGFEITGADKNFIMQLLMATK